MKEDARAIKQGRVSSFHHRPTWLYTAFVEQHWKYFVFFTARKGGHSFVTANIETALREDRSAVCVDTNSRENS
jgi:hypothetical protein